MSDIEQDTALNGAVMNHKITFDMGNQPGIVDGPIRRSSAIKAITALGLGPNHVTEVHLRKDDQVEVTAILISVEGTRSLGYRGPTKSDDDASGYIKHTYRVPVVDDEEAMPPSEYYGPMSADPHAQDPKPTNAEKWERYIRGANSGLSDNDVRDAALHLDEVGVKAPEADDE